MKTRINRFVRGSSLLVCGFGLLTLARAQEAPRFTGIQSLTNKEVLLKLSAPAGPNYRIDTTTNLPGWNGLLTVPGAASIVQHTDTAAPYHPSRVYRAVQLSGNQGLTGDHLATTNGDVVMHPIKHATFVMSWQGKLIYNDPVGVASQYSGLAKADLILVSHSHGDHFSATTIDAVRAPASVIIVPQAVYNSLSTAQKSITVVLTNGASANALGLAIAALPAYNQNHPRGTGNAYLLTVGGKRIYLSGDTEDIPEMRALADIDVAFVCMNVPYTMSVTKAVSAVREFRPGVVYPYHYQNLDNSFADLNAFKQQVGRDLGIEVRLRTWY